MIVRLLICCGFIVSFNVLAAIEETKLFNSFVEKMESKYQFDKTELKQLFDEVEIKPNIIETMTKPAEGLSWYKYRKIFMTDKRIANGVKFWQKHEAVLTKVEEKYGIPIEIMVSIIGVETLYGVNTGHHRVIDALSTLGFNYPKRSKFFLAELESFLILCREENMNPLEPTGSYAGAMGIPQFMPSSYRAYAADFENDEKRDIWNNPADAIASVANYFIKHRWHKGEAIVFPVTAKGDGYRKALTKGTKPDIFWAELQLHGMKISGQQKLKANEAVKLFSFQQKEGIDLWIGLNNFYVITRYNRSPMYAMVVYQLSEAIHKKRQQSLLDKKNLEKTNQGITLKQKKPIARD